jgi:hypothetical protein
MAPVKKRITLGFRCGGMTVAGDILMLQILTVAQKVTAFPVITDVYGNPARVDGVPTWAVSDETILELLPAADGLSCVILPRGPLGLAQVSVQADADLGAGVRPIAATADVEVLSAEAVAIGLTFGTPEPK